MSDRIPGFVEVGGRRLRHVIHRGSEASVVLVHGFGGSLETWASNLPVLADGGWTVAALDLPGHGESSTDVGGGSLDELAATVQAYLDVVGFGRAHLVGHSMGAAVSLALLDRAPQRVRSLALVGPAGIGQKINADYIRGFIGADTRETLEPLMRLLFAAPDCDVAELVDEALRFKRREGATAALARIAGSRYAGTRTGGTLRELAGTVPTLVIWGAADAVIPPPAPGEFVAPGVELHLLPGRGHMVHVEAAGEVNRLLASFLRR